MKIDSRRLMILLFIATLLLGATIVPYKIHATKRLNEALLRAVRAKDSRTVERLIHQGADPDVRDNPAFSNSVLQEVVRFLAHPRDKHPSSGAIKGTPALHIATKNSDLDTVQTLLKNGADINIRDEQGQTVLMRAIAEETADNEADAKSHNIISMLLQSGADVNAVDTRGKDALTLASESARYQIVMLLLTAGAAPNPNKSGKSWGGESLVLAAASEYREVINLLLDRGANIDYQCIGDGITALMNTNNVEIARLLVKRGANPNIGDKHGATALKYAMYHGNEEIIRLLQHRGAKE